MNGMNQQYGQSYYTGGLGYRGQGSYANSLRGHNFMRPSGGAGYGGANGGYQAYSPSPAPTTGLGSVSYDHTQPVPMPNPPTAQPGPVSAGGGLGGGSSGPASTPTQGLGSLGTVGGPDNLSVTPPQQSYGDWINPPSQRGSLTGLVPQSSGQIAQPWAAPPPYSGAYPGQQQQPKTGYDSTGNLLPGYSLNSNGAVQFGDQNTVSMGNGLPLGMNGNPTGYSIKDTAAFESGNFNVNDPSQATPSYGAGPSNYPNSGAAAYGISPGQYSYLQQAGIPWQQWSQMINSNAQMGQPTGAQQAAAGLQTLGLWQGA